MLSLNAGPTDCNPGSRVVLATDARQITVLTGPARSGKTTHLLVRYRQALQALPPGSTLWLAPNYRAAQGILERLLGPDLPGCFSPGVMTFDQLARGVLDASGQRIRRLGAFQKRCLLAWLIETARSKGLLKYFGPIADSPGLVDLVSGFITELKRLEIWPEHFHSACQSRGMTPKDRELAELYRSYQEALTSHDLYDAEGEFWSARHLLRQGQRQPLESLKLLVVDGFTDFTRTQHEILQILGEWVDEIHIALPLEDHAEPCAAPPAIACSGESASSPSSTRGAIRPGNGGALPPRADLFAKTADTLAELLKLPRARQQSVPRRRGDDWPAMAHLEAALFLGPRRQPPAPNVQGIRVLQAASAQSEIESIGRIIKQLLTGGDESLGGPVPPRDIAVAFRSVAPVASLVREVFAELGLPLALEAGQPLGRTAVAAFLRALLRLVADDFPYRVLLAVLDHNYFRPRWPGAEPWHASAAARVIRQAQVASGYRELHAAIQRRAESARRRLEAADVDSIDRVHLESEQREVAACIQVLEQLHQALQCLPAGAPLAQWSAALAQLAEQVGMLQAIGRTALRSVAQRDAAAWQRLSELLPAGEQLFAILGQAPPSYDVAAFVSLLDDLFESATLPRGHDDEGRVRVLSAASLRAVDVPYLFVAGLSEDSFPAAERHDRAYSEAELRQLRANALPLPLREDRSRAEMLLFYEVITRARKRLYLSYTSLNEKAEPLLPSPYLQEVERALGEGRIERTIMADLRPVPQSWRQHAWPPPQSPRELRIQAVHQALENNCSLLAGVARQFDAQLGTNLLCGIEAIHSRSRRDGFGVYEGILEGEALLAAVGELFGPDHPFSPSSLEQYARCPFQFLVQRVLRLEEPGELSLEIDALQRGGLLHEVLSRVHRKLNEMHGRPISPAEVDPAELQSLIQGALRDVLGRESPHSAMQAALRELDARAIARWLKEYHQQHQSYDEPFRSFDQPPRPMYFETSFGTQHLGDPPLSTTKPLVLQHAGQKVSISGRIDRIDVGQIGGRQVLGIIDYKSGAKPPKRPPANAESAEEPVSGMQLQLDLYAMAAQQVLFAQRAVALACGYWHPRAKGYIVWREYQRADEGSLQPDAHWPAMRAALLAKVVEMVEGIRAAQFPVYSQDKDCTGSCPYRTVCRIQQVRALDKTWPLQRE